MAAIEDEKIYGIKIRESANDGSDFGTPDTDYRFLYLGEDGQLHVKDAADAVTDIGGTVADILDLTTAETDDTLVLAPDGAGGVEFRAETGGGGVASGSSFPGSPSTGDVFFRTDRALLYYYDGTRWLTVAEYALNLSALDQLWPISSTGGGSSYAAVDEGANGAWITRLVSFTLVVGTNDGSNFWTVQIQSKAPGGTAHDIGSTFSTSADTAGNNTKHVVTVGAAVTSGDARYQSSNTKTGSASALYMATTVYYRLIG